jgi:hypothetical protein
MTKFPHPEERAERASKDEAEVLEQHPSRRAFRRAPQDEGPHSFRHAATNVMTACGEVDHLLCYFQRRSSKGRMMGKSWAVVAAAAIINVSPAFAETQTLTHKIRFCPTWAEAHERTLASLNNGRPPYRVRWNGCIELKRGTKVQIVKQDDEGTEIVLRGKHWFADE